MPFKKGNKYGGKRENAGRPPKVQQEIKKAASVIAREFIESHVDPVLQNYLKLAKGYNETRYTEKGTSFEVFVSDGPTTRHFVDKLLPEIKHDESSRPIAIQVIVEAPASSLNGHANGNGIAAAHAGNGGPILIGDG